MHVNSQPADIFTYSSLIDAFCENNHLDKAISLVKKIKEQGIQPDMYTYNILIDGLCKGGRLKNTQITFQDLLIKGAIR
jgi:pentatricopeptide repeat domain-containing protein 1